MTDDEKFYSENRHIIESNIDVETEELLRKLLVDPMSDDQIMRFCLKDTNSLLDAREKTRLENDMLEGFVDYLKNFGKTEKLGESILERRAWDEEIRQSVDWSDVPPDLRKKIAERAGQIIEFGLKQGWIERMKENYWQITDKGREFLAQGGYYIR